ncbi:type IV pilus modification PilV family protein [Catenovulum adriaticum]|uniref:Prepilin-type N-terminal cleavage/methylation domain-containing protein n=1 Tax=Catenovulum adriaticum TaxID=2984846 RepID=A0ABY7AL92_9ALTE|nr:prepilin-type N-terminal cleavage/methylation domain-containing protein [Catenovulum sp. TS8]WAJ70065.1 prepilin-type N-terminal cleavage/methylation domain-containing protein [Catenovulum sp. TS8]
MKLNTAKQPTGFTLIELIIGIMLIATAMLLFTGVLQNSSRFAADPWHQVRASELGSALMNEILAKSFDENSNRSGGYIRCSSNDTAAPDCSLPNTLKADAAENNRSEFDDIDDYNGLDASGDNIVNLNIAKNAELSQAYQKFRVKVVVFYDANFDGIADSNISQFKLIQINITDPLGNQTQFASYKGNY